MKKFGKQPPSKFTRHKGLEIGKWLNKEIIPNKDTLSAEQITKLDELGIIWDDKKDSANYTSQNHPDNKTDQIPNDLFFTYDNWLTYYVLCKEYLKEFQRLPSSEVTIEGKPIGKWLEFQFKDWRSGRLSLENISRIESLNEISIRYSSKG